MHDISIPIPDLCPVIARMLCPIIKDPVFDLQSPFFRNRLILSTSGASSSIFKSPLANPISVPCPVCDAASAPLTSKSTIAFFTGASRDCRIMEAIRAAPATWELEGPRITGPSTSLKILQGRFFHGFSSFLYQSFHVFIHHFCSCFCERKRERPT